MNDKCHSGKKKKEKSCTHRAIPPLTPSILLEAPRDHERDRRVFASGPGRRDIPADRVSIQSNLQAHEKSTLDNRQFLCSAASRGVTRLAKVGGGEDKDKEEEEERGDHGPVDVITASTVRGRREDRGREAKHEQ